MDIIMNGGVRWDFETLFQLIELFKERRILWDSADPGYKDRKKKYYAWLEIAAHFKTDKDIVERKVKCLTTQFRRELFKNGDVSRWFAYKKLMFLKPKMLASKMITQKDDKDEEDTTQEWQNDENETYDVEVDVSEPRSLLTETERHTAPAVQPAVERYTPRVIPKQIQVEEYENLPLTFNSRPVIKNLKEEDEFFHFGQSIAIQLKKLPELDALEMMHKMQLMIVSKKQDLLKQKIANRAAFMQPRMNTRNDNEDSSQPSTSRQFDYTINIEEPDIINSKEHRKSNADRVTYPNAYFEETETGITQVSKRIKLEEQDE